MKDNIYCTAGSCLLRTCGKHKCHAPRWFKRSTQWKDLRNDNCILYQSLDNLHLVDTTEDSFEGFFDEDEREDE